MDYFELLPWISNFLGLFQTDSVSGFFSEPFNTLWLGLAVTAPIFVALYVLQIIATYTVAKRGGFKHRWMAFIPFVNTYYIGVLADKNKFYNVKIKTFSLALAVVEFVLVAGYIFYYAVSGIIFAGGLYEIVTEPSVVTGEMVAIGYRSASRISDTWLGWVFDYFELYVLFILGLVYLVLHIFTLIGFFQTYACRRYLLLSLFAALFPIKGALMFAVRNNDGMNYREYMMGEQRRRYEMYQQYNRPDDNPYGYNPYSRNRGDRGEGQDERPRGSAPDPFNGLGGSSNQNSNGNSSSGRGGQTPPDDPFDEFKSK